MSPAADIPLSDKQIAVLHRAWRQAKKMGASPKKQKALIAAGIVESRGTHDSSVSGVDKDSVGFLQQRPSMGWGPEGESIEKDTAQFIRAAKRVGNHKGSAGQLAQAVQRSAHPGRYDEQGALADALLRRFQGRGKDAAQGHRTGDRRARDTVGGRAAAVEQGGPTLEDALELLRRDDVLGFAQTLKGIRDSEADRAAAERAAGEETPGRPATGARSSGGRRSGSTRKSHELHEFIWRGPGSITIDRGKRVPRDTFSGHDTHAHMAAGPNQIRAAGKLAQRMGLSVRENPGFGDDVDPVHTPGSHHDRRGKAKDGKTYGGAIDVSGDPKKVAEWGRRVTQEYGL